MSDDLSRLFETFARSAWRYEARDVYTVSGEEERIDAFLRTGSVPRKTRDNNGWIRTVMDARERGARIGRVRVLGRPVTDYTRFEFAAYPDNIAAGEDVAVIERSMLSTAWASVPDFWIFDDETAVVQHFDTNGRFLGAGRSPDPAPFREIRDLLAAPGRTVSALHYDLDTVPVDTAGHVPGPPALSVPAPAR